MKIALASDHGGLLLKAAIGRFLESRQISYIDLGVSDQQSVDYPDYAEDVAKRILSREIDAGILVCGTGIGMAIAANKFPGIRAAVVTDIYTAKMSKEHNDANIIAIGGRVVKEADVAEIVNAWLTAHFEGDRHQRRLDKIRDIERRYFKTEEP